MSPGPRPHCHEHLVTLMLAYEAYLLFGLEPPHLALYYSCFGCIYPVWTI